MSELAGTLYLVPTPLGNLEDMTFRGVRVLREAALVLAEDTRTARRLLAHYDVGTRLLSYTEHNHRARLPLVLRTLVDGDVALVSEAGMPAINDPGQALAAVVWQAGGRVVGLPGASAVPLAVAVSGFAWRAFSFLGFLPHAAGERRALLRDQAADGNLLIAFETPHRLRAALADIAAVLGERPIAVCRELTKLHEEVFRGTAAAALAHFVAPRGEITLVIAGIERNAAGEGEDAAALQGFLAERVAVGSSARDAVAAAMARFGVSRRAAYAAWERAKADAAIMRPC
ncbi:MAG TPA: 16S rRNA (cytidine(1402)-2'-O)-methyltransferase [Dehalococcoidia bacterium]|nr:16S rRNA (cytidine(1402)-2'-O)-methyltransferase [Dehalococcoidia bacterium]